MKDSCIEADRKALTSVAQALTSEAEGMMHEARDGRLRLVQNINTKLIRLGADPVTAVTEGLSASSHDLMEAGIEDEALCAHTRNFLAMALSRLERFDQAWVAGYPNYVQAQIRAALSEPPSAAD